MSAEVVSFERIRQLRAHEYVAEQIRRHVALRLIGPGESLPSERELAAMFGVGRPTVQRALGVLEADGLLRARRGRGGGTFVTEPVRDASGGDEVVRSVLRRHEEIDELLVLRRVIEPPLSRLAAEVRRRSDLDAIRDALAAMASATAEPEYMRHDTAFHVAIARAAHNRFLARMAEQARMGLNDAMTLLPESDAWHRRISGEHEAILRAVASGDGAMAHAASELHVANSEQGLRAVLTAAARPRNGSPR